MSTDGNNKIIQSEEDAKIFSDAIANPAEPNEKLKLASGRYLSDTPITRVEESDKKIERLYPDHYGLYNSDETIRKINELVDTVNQRAKPVLICRLPVRSILNQETIDKVKQSIVDETENTYHVIVIPSGDVSTIMFEVHNQDSIMAKNYITILSNLKL